MKQATKMMLPVIVKGRGKRPEVVKEPLNVLFTLLSACLQLPLLSL